MSSLLHPVGHLPASVYWFRRGLVLAVLALLFFLVLRLVPGGDDPKNSAAAGPQPSETPSAKSSDKPTPKPTEKTTTKPTAKASSTPPPKDVECSSSNVRVDVQPAVRRIASGATLNFLVKLDAVSGECKAAVDADSLTVTVTSGTDQIWTSAHCGKAIQRATLVVAKGKQGVSTVAWNGFRSGPGCLPGQPVAKPGTYVVKAEFSGRESAAQAFQIS
ncbi:hypothetical protein HPO96_20435 [Kribbella sandramycini]|uniref:Cytoskeletal protein RodZ n=1 Tax=Kribbella sandramycini TaxID=60450 RepID=A0A7Y4P001_9ACTN|nr:hypothetical protein [Kribbella sandramycini]MBB6564921.1 cytoskeletal protein RodZ [Kribbella sandramycini]NOL42617.1 hypothetical protein [Kribbella sandramycini]